MALVRAVGGTSAGALGGEWQLGATTAGRAVDPTALAALDVDWCAATGPTTVAAALRDARRWSLEDRVDFDASDWWWRCRFPVSDTDSDAARALCFRGIATLAEAWLNGAPILKSDNMFVESEVDVTRALLPDNELLVCCRSLSAALQARRPRPRWRTRVVQAQQMRWFRTTLLGRIPAWSPPVAPVGPWRSIVLERRSELAAVRADVRPHLAGDHGVVEVELALKSTRGAPIDRVTARVGEVSAPLACAAGEGGAVVARGEVRVGRVERWWPHTHGAAARYPVGAVASVDGREVEIDLGRAAFREVDVMTEGGSFGVRVGGVPVFCRGACWTPLDAARLVGTAEDYRATLEAVRDAGMNMVRVSGPFFYEEDAFYDTCDELGILVWQDFSFANMDYPGDDATFVASVRREARDFLHRTQLAACLTVLCGNSEVEQQAAMMGASREIWRSPLFSQTLPEACRQLRPDVPYWPSTPSGGPLPFSIDSGTAHYFGVGAYLRPLDDARRAEVRFATECLAFANVPDERVIDDLMQDLGTPTQHPRWKSRTPRDGGVGWDFDDVRDHYLRVRYGADPPALRYADVSRYLSLSRAVTGEVMAETYAEWRRAGSPCRGALVWFLRDLWPGAGWGVLGADGAPKAAYYYLRRVLQPVAAFFVDEGLNGLDVHVVNERERAVDARLDLVFLRDGEVPVATARAPVAASPRTTIRVRVTELLERFLDTTYAYRFGPPSHDVTVATLTDTATGATLVRAFHFPLDRPLVEEADVGVEAVATAVSGGPWRLTVTARRTARCVVIDVRDFVPDDNYFPVAPGHPPQVLLRPRPGASAPQGTARALNARSAVKITTKR